MKLADGRDYIQHVDDLFEDTSQEIGLLTLSLPSQGNQTGTRIEQLLNGGTYELVRERIPVEKRRTGGIFFTSSEMAEQVVTCVKDHASSGKPALDPACGTGDLLVAYAKQLPIHSTFRSTIAVWNHALHGYDIVKPFVRLTKLRLLLLLAVRGKFSFSSLPDIETLFPNIVCRDFLSDGSIAKSIKVILANPPFSRMFLENANLWGAGTVTAAAMFVDKLTRRKRELEIVAILPEVLRCGVRYANWRRIISARCESIERRKLGRFDRWTDVHVYLWRAKTRPHNVSSPTTRTRRERPTLSLGDQIFTIRVGAVVPFREKNKGKWVRYLDVSHAPRWGAVDSQELPSKRFGGSTSAPPFVVIRRTSSPKDKQRVVATVVTGSLPVAVENHLIVAQPVDRSIAACHRLAERLADRAVAMSLNRTMRCRHLTISSLAKLTLRE